MSFNAGAVRASLELGVNKFTSALRTAGKALLGFKNDTEKGEDGVGRFRRGLATLRDVMLALPGIINTVAAPLRLLRDGFVASSNAAADFQQTVRELSVSLALQGATDVPETTKALEEYAAQIQNTTAFSDGLVLQVAQTLTVLGVQQDQLEEATKATLDYSAATGREAVQSAINFGKTLGGVVGELGEAFPAVKELTEEQLKAGGAFELAAQQLGGFSEAVADTTRGLRAQFTNAVGDLAKAVGFAINPVLDQLTRLGTEAVKRVTDAVNGGREGLTAAFANIVGGLLDAAQTGLDFALDFPVLLAQGKAFIADFLADFRTGTEQIKISVLEAILAIQQALVALGESRAARLFFGADTFEALREGAASTEMQIAEATQRTAELEKGLRQAANEAREAAKAAAENAEALRTGADQTSIMAAGYNAAKDAIEGARSGLMDVNTEQKEITIEATKTQQATLKRLQHLREITGIQGATAGAADSVAASAASAAMSTQQLASAAREASDAFDDTAASAANVSSAASGFTDFGAGGGRGTGGAGFGRTRGGSAGFDLSTIGGAQVALDAARQASRASVGGLFSAQARRSNFLVGQQIQQQLNQLTEQAVADFTRGVIDELNRNGVLDPAQRQDIISARLDEARRLGVLPSGGDFGGGLAGSAFG